ncbi:hypothetical protein EJB05_44751 [Eragrostis curvula]|uniref:GDSL esterase/lipase n=1 Tax=Eragrostis curvula TaxID=38414 RepID=A0A5J9TIJ8_9POAL|nr:hypothetical protein EJB05_44739 [Eragrostis curvula]TVU11182.1 hypothetical protein EJB05_44751 [Eragrostis curvula]
MGHRSGIIEALVMCLVMSVQLLCATAGVRPPAIYVFGDSTLDIGNNDYLPGPDVPRANKRFYGVDFPGSVPTGRFSNGYNIADFIAMNMGFTRSPPPYLSLAQRTGLLVRSSLSTGVSYASAGAGILDSTHAGTNIPLSKQVKYFGATKSHMVAKRGSGAVNHLLSKSVFLISVGSNDLFVFAESSQNKLDAVHESDDVAALYSSLISNYSATINELYALGARRFAIINVGMLGCVPAARLFAANASCLDSLNKLASDFDDALQSMIAGVAAKLPGLAYSLADFYGFTETVFSDPGAVGYTDISGACCGAGELSAEEDCLPTSTLCANRDQHAFWDRVHPSQHAANLTAMNFYHSRPGRWTMPTDFKGLAEAS